MKKLALFLILLICSNNLFANEIRNTLEKNWSEIYQKKIANKCTCLGPSKKCSDLAKPANTNIFFQIPQFSENSLPFISFRHELFFIKKITNHYLLASHDLEEDYDIKISNKNSLGLYIIDLVKEKTLFYCE